MKPRYFIPPAIVVLACILAVVVSADMDANKMNAIAGETPAVNETNGLEEGFSPFVDQQGKISLPTGYKQKWAHLGSWAVSKKAGETVHEMHDVYTQHETISAYNSSGEFPDGAVLVKQVRETEADRLTAGHAAWSTNTKIWFVMIKDRKERFQDNDHWGDGWGWALFEAKDRTKNVSAGYDTSCLGCHTPVEDSDWVYTYGYPELKRRE
jgi:hypothetical protein